MIRYIVPNYFLRRSWVTQHLQHVRQYKHPRALTCGYETCFCFILRNVFTRRGKSRISEYFNWDAVFIPKLGEMRDFWPTRIEKQLCLGLVLIN